MSSLAAELDPVSPDARADVVSGPRPTGRDTAAVRGRTPGTEILDGKYRLEKPLAVGGMGAVWRARHTTLDRPVAVKFVDVDPTSEVSIERFFREAKVAAGIQHPNVVDVLDFGRTATGEAVMVMELVEGRPLDVRMLDADPIPTTEAVLIAAQVLAGLEAVHRAGVVHRDIKPGNVVLTENDGESFARILDFGISHSIDPKSDLRRGRFGTSEQLVVGTPQYMPPEQAEGRPDLDARADLYAVGVMLYEMLTGVLPYDHEHSGALLCQVIQGKHTPFVELRPDLPEIGAVVERAMARDREDRPSSAHELRRILFAAAGLGGGLITPTSGVRLSLSETHPGAAGRAELPTGPVELTTIKRAPRRRSLLGITGAIVSVLGAGACGLALFASRPSPAPSAPVPTIVAAPAVVVPPAPAPITAGPPPVDHVEAEPPSSTAVEPAVPTRRAVRARTARRSEERAERTPELVRSAAGVVRDLDF